MVTSGKFDTFWVCSSFPPSWSHFSENGLLELQLLCQKKKKKAARRLLFAGHL